MNILFFIFCLNNSAMAEDAVTLNKGARAPFTGTLLSPDAAVKLLTDYDAELAICKARSEYLLDKQLSDQTFNFNLKSAELVSCQYRHDANKDLYESNIEYLQKQAITPSWEKPAWFAGGIVTGIAVILTSAWTLDKIQEN
jgi:hypothetical protein